MFLTVLTVPVTYCATVDYRLLYVIAKVGVNEREIIGFSANFLENTWLLKSMLLACMCYV